VVSNADALRSLSSRWAARAVEASGQFTEPSRSPRTAAHTCHIRFATRGMHSDTRRNHNRLETEERTGRSEQTHR
jgi:hypothetical protein